LCIIRGLYTPASVFFIVFVGEISMNMHKGIIVATFSGLLLAGLAACEKEGPAEKAGKAIDEAASNVADEASEVTETIEKKVGE
jgi:hypothetical protein